MAKFTLVRHSDGQYIHTDSAVEANDLVANGVADHAPAPAPQARASKSSTDTSN